MSAFTTLNYADVHSSRSCIQGAAAAIAATATAALAAEFPRPRDIRVSGKQSFLFANRLAAKPVSDTVKDLSLHTAHAQEQHKRLPARLFRFVMTRAVLAIADKGSQRHV